MGCCQPKSIKIRLVYDHSLGAWRVSASMREGKTKSRKSYRFIQSLAKPDQSVFQKLSFGHIGQHTLLVYHLQPLNAWSFGYALGQEMSDLKCSCMSIPIHVIADGFV